MYQAVTAYVKPLQCKIDKICCLVNSLVAKEGCLDKELEYQKCLIQKLREELYLTMSQVQGYVWYTGYGNNLAHPTWGTVGTQLRRRADNAYGDGISTLAIRGPKDPSPRVVSNRICSVSESIKNSHQMSDYIWVWGQFLDHELDLTEPAGTETVTITTSTSDPYEEYGDPQRTIPFTRSKFIEMSEPREHPNEICSFINGGVIYGTDRERVYTLRKMDGTGKMKMYKCDCGEILLPKNRFGLPNAQDSPHRPAESFFVSGDIRANENVYLTGMHTLFMREHNRLCDEIVKCDPCLKGHEELIFQKARRLVVASLQKITYHEFLPILLGKNGIPSYSGYKANVDSSIHTEFSTVGYRVGHSMLSSLLHADNKGNKIQLREAFFNPGYIDQNGVDKLIFGASQGLAEKIDSKIVDDVRNFLFGPPTSTQLLDLATLNITRGRDHGIPDYNSVREAYGLNKKTTWSEITSDTDIASGLEDLYETIEAIDPWVGAICEDHYNSLPIGELIYTILRDQFIRIRDGDRFWYQNQNWEGWEKCYIEKATLSEVIKNNTRWKKMHADPFHV